MGGEKSSPRKKRGREGLPAGRSPQKSLVVVVVGRGAEDARISWKLVGNVTASPGRKGVACEPHEALLFAENHVLTRQLLVFKEAPSGVISSVYIHMR